MSTLEITPAIMIGGAGSRLWPLSRANKPKQFLKLGGNGSLFQNTMTRFRAPGFGPAWLLANSNTLTHVTRQLDELALPAAGIIVEPGMRGTAAAITAATLVLNAEKPDALILVAPADHFIRNEAAFRRAVLGAAPIAATGNIVTFGITPTGPETGFGYIEPGSPLQIDGSALGYLIGAEGFREKPAAQQAEQFVADGYLWNAGIFLFPARTMLKELAQYAPETLAAVSAACAAGLARDTSHGRIVEPEADAFLEAPLELSIDVAVMERTSHAVVVPCADIGWNDVGSLSALWEIASKDRDGNAIDGNSVTHHSRNVFIHSGSGRKIVASHLSDTLIVDTEDALIVLPASEAQSVKAIVGMLKSQQAPELAYQHELQFNWGEVHVDRADADHCVLSLHLDAGKRITRHRCATTFEVWTVTSGQLSLDLGNGLETLTIGDTVRLAEGDVLSLVAVRDDARIALVTTSLDGRDLEDMFAPGIAAPGRARIRAPELPGQKREVA